MSARGEGPRSAEIDASANGAGHRPAQRLLLREVSEVAA
jgi:hypothetical protein